MGREIRIVPPNWQHPNMEEGYAPLYNRDVETAMSAGRFLPEILNPAEYFATPRT